MKQIIFTFLVTILILLLCCVSPLFSQPEQISNVDFSRSRLSIAGPDEVYIRGIMFEGESYSAVVKTIDEEGTHWQISKLYGEDKNLAPKEMYLDFVQVIPQGRNKLTFSGIIVDGTSYKASFTIDEAGTLRSEAPIREAAMPEGAIEETLGSLKDLIVEAEKEKYEKKIATLMKESEEKTETIGLLQEENKQQLQQKENLISSLSKENEELHTNLETVKEELEAARQEAAEAGGGEASADDGNGSRIDDFNYTKTLLEGFSQSVPQLGYWNVIGNTATQTDEDQYFAKLVLPIKQQTKPTLFTFQTRSRGFGWVGTGMHIFATDDHALKGYGYGNSLLVWLTRDPDYYGSADTRLQLYRSDDAVQMEMVLDAIIEEPMTEYLDVAILYEPEAEYITISVNGIEKLRYKTWFGIDTGLEIALRSLGGYADFKNLKVMTTE